MPANLICEYLRRRGGHLAQGFLFSPPLPAAELADYMAACAAAAWVARP